MRGEKHANSNYLLCKKLCKSKTIVASLNFLLSFFIHPPFSHFLPVCCTRRLSTSHQVIVELWKNWKQLLYRHRRLGFRSKGEVFVFGWVYHCWPPLYFLLGSALMVVWWIAGLYRGFGCVIGYQWKMEMVTKKMMSWGLGLVNLSEGKKYYYQDTTRMRLVVSGVRQLLSVKGSSLMWERERTK